MHTTETKGSLGFRRVTLLGIPNLLGPWHVTNPNKLGTPAFY